VVSNQFAILNLQSPLQSLIPNPLSSSPYKPGLKLNAAWNCVGTVSDALLAILITPFTLHTLGDSTYGLWALIGAMTGCFGLLDLGVRGALGRQLAFHRARHDQDNANATLNTALALLAAACGLTLLGVAALQVLFFWIFDVPAELVAATPIALAIAGLRLALSFPLSAFDATLWAAERFDRLNQIDMAVNILKAVSVYLLLTSANGLVALPLISLVGLLLAGSLKAVHTWMVYERLSFGLRHLSRAALRSIFGFGLWNFAGALSGQAIARIPPIVIGALISPGAVTPYAIADRIMTAFSSFFTALSGALTPRSAAYSARDDHSRQHRLFLQGGRACAAVALFSALGICFFAHDVIRLWIGPRQSVAAVYLIVLACGMVIPFSQSITQCILLGMARHRILNVITMVQAIVITPA
jgi:O-antigen/teichoic acid export membrane protein